MREIHASSSLRWDFLPARPWIERCQSSTELSRTGAEILLEDLPVMVHDERRHPALAVPRRIRHHRKAGNHAAVDDVAVRTAGCVLALARENAEVIAVI